MGKFCLIQVYSLHAVNWSKTFLERFVFSFLCTNSVKILQISVPCTSTVKTGFHVFIHLPLLQHDIKPTQALGQDLLKGQRSRQDPQTL